MSVRWSLYSLYPDFDSQEFLSDYKRLDHQINKIKDWSFRNSTHCETVKERLEEIISLRAEYKKMFSRLRSYSSLSLSADARNEKASSFLEKLQIKSAEFKAIHVQFEKWVGSLDNLEEIIDSSDILKEHKFYLKEVAQRKKYLLSEKEEVLIAKMRTTGSKAWSKLQDKVLSTLLVDITLDGQKKCLPLPVVRNMAQDMDQKVRKVAYEAELNAYKKIEESSAAALNGIKGEAITLTKMRGYKTPLEKTLIDSRMDQETLNAMLTAMKDRMTSFHKYFYRKGELLGHKNGLPFYEIFAPMGEVNKKFSYEEARSFLVKHFKPFSKKLADFIDQAFEKQWIDAEIRDGKRGTAFCSHLHSIKESRISINYSGSLGSVITLAHELGHAYQGFCLSNESIFNSIDPMPLAETGSIFNEIIVMDAALKQAEIKERFAILEKQISSAGLIIVDIYSRFLFESELFKRREDHLLSVNELKEMMLDAQKQAYGNSLDPEQLHPYTWICKPHYYYASTNFYNFPYSFGLLFAKGLYSEYLKRGEEFVGLYDQLLSVSGKMAVKDVASTIGIDITSPEFWRSSLTLIENDIEEFIKLSNVEEIYKGFQNKTK